jgi:hypothetical protein
MGADWYHRLVRVTVDRGIGPDTELEIQTDGVGLRLQPISPGARAVLQADGLPLLAPVEGLSFGDADLSRLRDEVQQVP